MELKAQEVSDGKLWLLCAGACAVALSFFIWRVDEYMVGASARESAHNQMMQELRSAQAHIPAAPVDNRQALPLTIEDGESAVALPHDAVGEHAQLSSNHGDDSHGAHH